MAAGPPGDAILFGNQLLNEQQALMHAEIIRDCDADALHVMSAVQATHAGGTLLKRCLRFGGPRA
jgi:hypothetical protein